MVIWMEKLLNVICTISKALFILGISIGLICVTFFNTKSYENYTEIQPESFVPDEIETVLYDEDLKQIYVCYNDANCVNVYTENGEFLWCVGTPYLRNTDFELQDGKLIICDGNAYVYDSSNGEFIGLENEENLNLSYEWNEDCTFELHNGKIIWDFYDVYRVDTQGNWETIISRQWWHYLCNFGLWWCVAFTGAAGIGLSVFLKSRSDYKSIKKKVTFKNQKAEKITKYFKITSFVQIAYTVLNIICIAFDGILCVGLIPLALHFIISNIVLWNMSDKLKISNDEEKVLNYNKILNLATFVIAFISVAIVSSLVG